MHLDEAQSLEDQVCENKVEAMEQEYIDIDAKKEEYKNTIQLNIQDNIVYNYKNKVKQCPVVIQLQSIKAQQTQNRTNIDLICVIMLVVQWKVKKQNQYIQKILDSGDRIALVSFASSSYVNLPWTRNLPENKNKIKKAIKNMKIRDSTKIANGLIQVQE
ncbi:unnamed protein product [Paramecium sonneborni]|uniref:VWFA domain-containing protein n=1 Tax=Paramecium sonneborni TaxID=65129 RepID=A0A8S1R7K8_9CILI|nr:unnamed protein product [Paramecium sonneborni]